MNHQSKIPLPLTELKYDTNAYMNYSMKIQIQYPQYPQLYVLKPVRVVGQNILPITKATGNPLGSIIIQAPCRDVMCKAAHQSLLQFLGQVLMIKTPRIWTSFLSAVLLVAGRLSIWYTCTLFSVHLLMNIYQNLPAYYWQSVRRDQLSMGSQTSKHENITDVRSHRDS